jgi:protein-S-isoprenylcysteine O-methyltransferase Ste14
VSADTIVPVFSVLACLQHWGELAVAYPRGQWTPERRTASVRLGAGYLIFVLATLSERAMLSRGWHPGIAVVGIVCWIARTVLKVWVMRTLGRHWSVRVELRDDHRLITAGPYRFLRHPAYLSNLLGIAGMSLVPNAYISLCLGFCAMALLIAQRVPQEERALAERFGGEYAAYRRRTSALIPFLF